MLFERKNYLKLGERRLLRRTVSGIILVLLLTGMPTLIFSITPVSGHLEDVIRGNLIKNPGFENQLSFWSVSIGTATYSGDNTNFHSGAYSTKGVEIHRGSLGRLYQNVTDIMTPGKQYKISGWIKTQDAIGYVVIGLDYVDSSGATPADGYVKEIGYVTGSTDWIYYESDAFTLPHMPSDATAIWFLLDFNDGNGTAWCDDVSLVEIPLVLMDEGHSEWLVSSNAQFLTQDLEERGYLVQTLGGTITASSLENCDVLIIGTAWGSFTQNEIQVIEDFVKNGGGLLLTGLGWSWVDYHPESTIHDYPMNKIAQRFGAFFNPDIIFDPTDYTIDPGSAIFHSLFIESHPVTQGVTRIGATGSLHGSINIEIGTILITGDNDSYGGYHESPYPNPGSHPPNCAAIEYGSGRVIVISQEGFFIDDRIDEYNNKILGMNIFYWLSAGPYYELMVTSSPLIGITLAINGTPQTTPYTEWSLQDSYTLQMPENHNEYVWSYWLEDSDANRTRVVIMDTNITLTGVFHHFCDLDKSGCVDMKDIAAAALAFGSDPSHPRWNPCADINKDNKVNLMDIGNTARNFGKT